MSTTKASRLYSDLDGSSKSAPNSRWTAEFGCNAIDLINLNHCLSIYDKPIYGDNFFNDVSMFFYYNENDVSMLKGLIGVRCNEVLASISRDLSSNAGFDDLRGEHHSNEHEKKGNRGAY
ncbi:hypothetical protein AMTRI_Chr12g234940 [Amborella trichopoda]